MLDMLDCIRKNRENDTAQLLMAVLLFIEWIDSICGNQNGSNSAIMLNLSFSISAERFYKDNIALNVILSFKNSNQCLCITNTHIHANPNNNDVKLFQVYYLLKELESLVQKNCGIPETSILYLVNYGELQPAEMFEHTLPLVSAYSSYFQCDLEQREIARKMNDDTREHHFTNFSSDFRGTLDYILYSRTNLKVASLLELVGQDEVENGALPSPNCPSDHIALVAKFSYILIVVMDQNPQKQISLIVVMDQNPQKQIIFVVVMDQNPLNWMAECERGFDRGMALQFALAGLSLYILINDH
jgi:mRNA deadenylase 3'-5' endonuclease subunit Ccr4